MPPVQCPECGRFLKNAFVADLARSPAPCPKCGTELSADRFDPADLPVPTEPPAPPAEPAAAAPEEATAAPPFDPDGPPPPPPQATDDAGPVPPPPPAVSDLADASVRPPDLAPESVRDDADPLAGWDADAPAAGGPVADERPFPTDTVVVGGAGLLGLLAGLLWGRRRGRDALLGAAAGLAVAAVVRRIWRSP